MKHIIYNIAIAAALTLTAAGCDKDGDTIYAAGAPEAQLDGKTTDIVLDKDNLDALALTIYWADNGEITLSDPRVAAANDAVTNVIQFAADAEFVSTVDETMASGTCERQYTCKELNSLLSRLGYEGNVKAPVYIRVKSSLGDNVAPTYSNTLIVNVTPYKIDMTIGFYLNASQEDTGHILYSPESNGIYTGFIGAGGWENWWLREGDSTIWGNDGVTGTAFVMGNSNTGNEVWNFWYPGLAGCYYTVVNTQINEWSALLIPALTLGGDLSGEMTFERKSNQWVYTFNAASAGTINISISGTGKQYNAATGTDDAAAIDTPVSFAGDANSLTWGNNGSIAVNIPAAGETTLVLDLNDPRAYKVYASAGAPEPQPTIYPSLYLSGVYGDWTFDWYVSLYDEDNLNYGAALPVNSEWGYRIYTEVDNWGDYYSMVDGGNAYEGQLVYAGEGNVAAPDPGFYLFDISLGSLSYKLTSITKVSYSGLNDDWSLTEMTPTDQPGVYTAHVVKSANTPWGVKIILNDNWDLYFGGNGTPGQLALYQNGFEGDNDLENGEYILTVDLAHCTYSYSK